MAVAEIGLTPDREALRLGMTIAAGIGLHNFSEGLAIGQAAKTNEISLAVLLVVGFALHNATEGFGIVGPLGDGVRDVGLAPGRRPRRRWSDLPRDDRRYGVQLEYAFVAFWRSPRERSCT